MEPVSSRLKGELIHPNRNSTLWEIRFSPDGKRIMAGDYPGGVVVVWDVETGKQLTAIETGHSLRSGVEFFSVSPDWRALFVSHEKSKLVRIEKDGKRLRRVECDGDVRAWDLSTGQLIRTYKHQPARSVRSMQLSPDGTKFVTYDELPGDYERQAKSAVSLWDVKTGQYITLADDLQTLGRFSPNGRLMAITAVDKDAHTTAVKLVDTATGKENLSIPINETNTYVFIAGISPDGRLVLGQVSNDTKKSNPSQGCLKLWDAATGQEAGSLAAEKNGSFMWACFSADGRMIAAMNSWQGERAKLFLFRVSDKQLIKTIVLGERTKGERLITRRPVFSTDGKWLAVCAQVFPDTRGDLDAREAPQARIHVVDVSAGEIRETLISPPGFPIQACFSPDGRTLASGGHGRVLLWDMTKLPDQTAGVRE